jgi:hypothetical protein
VVKGTLHQQNRNPTEKPVFGFSVMSVTDKFISWHSVVRCPKILSVSQPHNVRRLGRSRPNQRTRARTNENKLSTSIQDAWPRTSGGPGLDCFFQDLVIAGLHQLGGDLDLSLVHTLEPIRVGSSESQTVAGRA